jgi:segregation and condensation protein B
LDHFGLERLTDLPGMDELKAAGLLDKRPAIEAMPNPADLFDGQPAEGEDPQEVTDEDLLGGTADDTVMESSAETEAVEEVSEEAGEEAEDLDDEDDDFDDEDGEDDEEDAEEEDEE